MTVYLYHEAHYREQLTELKERRKEVKRECATINRCISESTFAHMEIPLDVDVENLYMVNVPEFEGSKISYEESEDYDEVEAYKAIEPNVDIEVYEAEQIEVADVLPELDEAEPEPVTMPFESINESVEVVDEVYADLQDFTTPDMTKERYEALTDKEKVEWLGIADCSVQDAIQRFISKLDSIGVVYRYSDDMLDEFMRLEAVAEKLQQEQKMEEEISMGGVLFKEGKKSR